MKFNNLTFLLVIALFASQLQAQTGIPTTAIDGKYTILTPERSPKGGTTQEILMQYAERNGQKMLVTAACEQGCTPAVYTYQQEPSETLGVPVFFNSFGFYVIGYDNNSFVSVIPDAQLGKGIWKVFRFSNFYSKDASKVSGMTTDKITAYAIQMSEKIMAPSSASASFNGGDGTYHFAVGITYSGKKYESAEVTFTDGAVKKLITQPCDDCGSETYIHLPEYSKLIGVDVYGNSRREYVYVDKPGVLIWTIYTSDLGKQLWGKNDNFNLIAQDKQLARGLLIDTSKQEQMDAKVANWSKIIKDYEDKKRAAGEQQQIDAQRLPKKGLSDSGLEAQALKGAKAWAASYNWKETVTAAYFTSNDWFIRRHKITGIQTGREIRGVIVMKRPDGLCSFHHALFAQQYDGSKYLSVFTDGITPGQIKLKCEYAE